MGKKIVLNVNEKDYSLEIEDNEILLDTIREKIGLKGTKYGCGTGECGACTVLIDGAPVNSCIYLAIRAEGKKIITVEGLKKVILFIRYSSLLLTMQQFNAVIALPEC